MSIINSTRNSRPRAARIALIPALALGLIGGPVAMAGPATASNSERGCTVDPLKPVEQDNKDRGKDRGKDKDRIKFDFRIEVSCDDKKDGKKDGKKTVQIRQLRFENDRGRHDDFLGRSTFWESFDHRDDAVKIHSYDSVRDRPGSEEVYHLVSYRVRSDNSDHWSDWSGWEKSESATSHK